MKLKDALNEAEDWTGKDLIVLKKNITLAQKSLIGAIRNVQKLEQQMSKLKNKPQASILYSMLPNKGQIKAIDAISAKLDKLVLP